MPRVKSGEPPRPTIGVKYPTEVQARIHAVTKTLGARAGGVSLSISSVMNQIVLRGLDALEKELSTTLKPSKAPKSAA
jgi:hypothetical protein